MNVLEVRNLGKAYRHYSAEWRRILSWFGLPFTSLDERWVLQDINFCVGSGESAGIIGHNGAGKSTLLKLITGTSQPSQGNVVIKGRIAAILELGMGFNPEFSGRDNARYGLGLLGYERSEIDDVMPYVEKFSEIGAYFDQPVRTYSSGMQMRLAFAVSTAFTPDILIVDEALSVGDAYFQHKCYNRIRELQNSGMSLLLVSHDKDAILAICDKVILINEGKLLKEGKPDELFDFYNALIAEKEANNIKLLDAQGGRLKTVSGTGEAAVVDISLLNSKGELAGNVYVGEPLKIIVDVAVHKDLDKLVLGFMIRDRLGLIVFGTSTFHLGQVKHDAKKGDRIRYEINFVANMGVGSYSVSTVLTSEDTHVNENYEWVDNAMMFTVENRGCDHFVGSNWLSPSIFIDENI